MHQFRAADLNIIFLHVTTYALSSTVLPVVQRAKVPVIVLNHAPVSAIDYERFNRMSDRTAMTGGMAGILFGVSRSGNRQCVSTGWDQFSPDALRCSVTTKQIKERVAHFKKVFAGQRDCSWAELERAAKSSFALDRFLSFESGEVYGAVRLTAPDEFTRLRALNTNDVFDVEHTLLLSSARRH